MNDAAANILGPGLVTDKLDEDYMLEILQVQEFRDLLSWESERGVENVLASAKTTKKAVFSVTAKIHRIRSARVQAKTQETCRLHYYNLL